MPRLLTITLLFFLSFSLFSQEKGNLVISIKPKTANVFIDGTKVNNMDTINLIEGKHHITASKESFNSIADSIFVFRDSTTVFSSYLYYQKPKNIKKESGNAILTISKASAVGLILYGSVQNIRTISSKDTDEQLAIISDKIASSKEQVETSTTIALIEQGRLDYQSALQEYNVAVNEHNREVTNSIITNSGIIIIGGALTYFLTKRNKKKKASAFTPIINTNINQYEVGFLVSF